ncbi:large ribosomal subunit protein mL55 isoform X1 [Heptranchias perlo]|uniref:large ribosomal subunit protein mL55 isoform X1 n=1 Tax=Heptranchias perlo TaxID=212740 RepID=UPI003559BF6B
MYHKQIQTPGPRPASRATTAVCRCCEKDSCPRAQQFREVQMASLWSALLCRFVTSLQLNASERLLPAMYPVHSMTRRNNSNRTSIVRCGRQAYGRLYPVLMVRPDGSTINIRYKEPKKMITMPVDVSLLPEAERKARMRKRDPKKAKMKEEEFEDEFKVNDYSKFWKKK